MRKFMKDSILEICKTMYEAHKNIKSLIEKKDYDSMNIVLGDCQSTAIQLGEVIEQSEGEGFITVSYLEEYCEELYKVSTSVNESYNVNKAQKSLDKILIKIENSVKNDISVKLEIIVMPYKASMWDSLESIWRAALNSQNCNVHVIPIPYYDRNPDGTLGEMHYEGADFPEYVPLLHYEQYDLEKMRPDVIYIHNPYDEFNNVTSVDSRYYSHELAKYTLCLVYVPYYATAGGMSEAQKCLSVYYHADYIICQSEHHKKYFDPNIQHKLLVFGSPKFDRVINMCNNSPTPPVEWADRMAGKRVFFYNTSLGGMLADTEVFLKKMQYVFETFAKHPEVCLLWRPHPLLESTFDSMRPGFKEWFIKLKEFFLQNDLGIYDTTPDITNTIALSDCYIGDSGTSVTSLFGMAGKPLFILNNYINMAPEEDDWRGEIIRYFNPYSNVQWLVTKQNQLFYSPNNDFTYKYVCSLSEYSNGGYYLYAVSNNNKTYICPANAEDVVVVSPDGIEKRIKLENHVERAGAFAGAVKCGDYIFLIPNRYPAIVRINTNNDNVTYIRGYSEIITQMIYSISTTGGFAAMNGYVYIASPVDNRLIAIDSENCSVQFLTTGGSNEDGCLVMQTIGNELMFMPMKGYNIRLWNPETGKLRSYNAKVDEATCINPMAKCYSDERPFFYSAVYNNCVYLTPMWSDKHVKLDLNNGNISVWNPPFKQQNMYKNGYYFSFGRGYFTNNDSDGKNIYLSIVDRKLYSVDLSNSSCEEILIDFNIEELKTNESGFGRYSQWLRYCCEENSFNSLDSFISGNITGNQFDRNEQIKAFGEYAANPDGSCGVKTHDFIKNKVLN